MLYYGWIWQKIGIIWTCLVVVSHIKLKKLENICLNIWKGQFMQILCSYGMLPTSHPHYQLKLSHQGYPLPNKTALSQSFSKMSSRSLNFFCKNPYQYDKRKLYSVENKTIFYSCPKVYHETDQRLMVVHTHLFPNSSTSNTWENFCFLWSHSH